MPQYVAVRGSTPQHAAARRSEAQEQRSAPRVGYRSARRSFVSNANAEPYADARSTTVCPFTIPPVRPPTLPSVRPPTAHPLARRPPTARRPPNHHPPTGSQLAPSPVLMDVIIPQTTLFSTFFRMSSVCLPVRLSVRPSVRPSVCPSVRPSVRPPVRPSVRPSILTRTSDTSLVRGGSDSRLNTPRPSSSFR